jgi:precorrin-3B C17-methyltransferase
MTGILHMNTEHNKTMLSIVGIGPGSFKMLTPQAKEAIDNADIIIGYRTYVNLITDLIKDKPVVSTGMKQEIDRCREAIDLCCKGKNVALISSGDPGIYGMAGLVFELLKGEEKNIFDTIDVAVIPGITALNSCASVLGAPLMHDFASISLSDLLTPLKVIVKRIEAAASADFVIVLYNPKSKKRTRHLGEAVDIILRYRSPHTPVGIVKNAGREGESAYMTTLKDIHIYDIDMLTTVIIGNSETFIWRNWMVTPRGYAGKYEISSKDFVHSVPKWDDLST